MKKILESLRLFLVMLKIGLFTFGGGYAMIALLEGELVSKRKWIDSNEFIDMVAIAESTPGPIAVNAATFVGYKRSGVLGSLFATFGVCLPSFVIIYLISLFLNGFMELKLVSYAFSGRRVAVIFLIGNAGIKFFKSIEKTPFNVIVMSLTFVLMVIMSLLSVDFSTVFYILISGVTGLLLYLLGNIKKGGINK